MALASNESDLCKLITDRVGMNVRPVFLQVKAAENAVEWSMKLIRRKHGALRSELGQ